MPPTPPRPLTPPTVADLGERRLIERIRARTGDPAAWVTLGIGDDAAVVTPARGRADVLTTDTLVEDVHFRRAWMTPSDIGRKAVAVSLSDLAAMGASPRALLLSLSLPSTMAAADFDGLIDGVVAETTAAGGSLVGGNLTRSPGPLVVTVTAQGAIHPRRVLTRHGGRPDDEIWVTGAIGAASAGLEVLEAGLADEALSPALACCVARYRCPEPRLRFGRLSAGSRSVSACMDLSDGLADAVRQLAGASGTGALVNAKDVPVTEAAREWWAARGVDPVEAALAGGEDYELALVVPPRRRRGFLAAASRASDLPVTMVGRLTADPGVWLERDGRLVPLPSSYRHY